MGRMDAARSARRRADALRMTFVGAKSDTRPEGREMLPGKSNYFGGDGFDAGSDITVDAQGNAYVTGQAASRNFPTTAGALTLTWSTGRARGGRSYQEPPSPVTISSGASSSSRPSTRRRSESLSGGPPATVASPRSKRTEVRAASPIRTC